jgi:hypothetical protein
MQPVPSAVKHNKARTFEDIVAEFGSIDQVTFEPIKLETYQDAQALLPPTFKPTSSSFDYFTLFFTPDLFQTITTNTNRYTTIQRIRAVEEDIRK